MSAPEKGNKSGKGDKPDTKLVPPETRGTVPVANASIDQAVTAEDTEWHSTAKYTFIKITYSDEDGNHDYFLWRPSNEVNTFTHNTLLNGSFNDASLPKKRTADGGAQDYRYLFNGYIAHI